MNKLINDKSKGFWALLGAGAIFGSFGIWIKLLSSELSNFQQIAYRNFIALFIAVLIVWYFKIGISLGRVDKKHLIRFGISFPLSVIFFTYSFVVTKIVLGIFSFYVGSILFSLILGIYLFKEKIDTKKVISLIMVLVGLLFFILPVGIDKIDRGIVFGLVAGFFDAVANSYRKYLSGKMHRILLTAIPLFGGLLISVILMLINKQPLISPISTNGMIVGLVFGVLLFVVNYLTFVGFSNFDLNLGTIVISSELFFASLFGYLVFNEIPLKNEVIGGVIIILAIVVSNINLINNDKK